MYILLLLYIIYYYIHILLCNISNIYFILFYFLKIFLQYFKAIGIFKFLSGSFPTKVNP